MERREALKNIATLIGVTAATALAMERFNFLARCTNKSDKNYFSESEQKIVSEISGMIIPTTSTPGAIEAGVPAFIEMMLQDCYRKPEQESFQKGLEDVEAKANALGNDFISLTPEQKRTVLTQIESEALAQSSNPPSQVKPPTNDETKTLTNKPRPPVPSFWQLMKELTLLGYFTSEIGMTKAMVYVPVPGRIEAIKIKSDQKAYSEYTDRLW
ncbi:gluconate 2-dehydrogenase subunit 3 family protein [Chitinophagaceae bacterium LB-8]|uniref:Gluconate 2-dehydrogenase subunit 3 family protein n=1 Tax=Paraflavisolibacter caeni TaxID=2982496 RepID=A0A9X2XW59_9BACT|nr:gluconate 2-dehydrogenase subunit 3 family protein [Paraflavisolibacter caeni]MCU7549766.1 gluconate 2-dehydrogenase subunit 3 family protein [Paraflavisolibacter caeni]